MMFFKQKTAYEMRISDSSSDVCSSDLLGVGMRVSRPGGDAGHALAAEAYSYFQHPADDRRQAPLPPLSYRMAPRRLAAGRHVRSIINDNAYADRRAPPGGNPGRRRQGKPDRGI